MCEDRDRDGAKIVERGKRAVGFLFFPPRLTYPDRQGSVATINNATMQQGKKIENDLTRVYGTCGLCINQLSKRAFKPRDADHSQGEDADR